MTDTTMRQAFEDFVLSKPGAGAQTIFRKEYPCSGSYCSSSVEFGWISWQAATERATPQWQDIATAPKDGTPVLLWGLWAGEVSGPLKSPKVEVGYYGKGGDYPGFDWCATGGDYYGVWGNPTHWMPLPTPPEGSTP